MLPSALGIRMSIWLVPSTDPIHNVFNSHKPVYVFHFAAYAAEGLSPFIRAFNYDKTFVELSTDYGSSWTSIELNDQVTTNDPAIQELVGINISSYVGGQQGVKIRFRWTSDSDDDSFGSGYRMRGSLVL